MKPMDRESHRRKLLSALCKHKSKEKSPRQTKKPKHEVDGWMLSLTRTRRRHWSCYTSRCLTQPNKRQEIR